MLLSPGLGFCNGLKIYVCRILPVSVTETPVKKLELLPVAYTPDGAKEKDNNEAVAIVIMIVSCGRV